MTAATSERSKNLTVPNAHCPVCGETVFFFQDSNGGRVFFDPPLGAPWSPHPCTTSRSEPVLAFHGVTFDEDAVDPEAWFADALPRPGGLILRIGRPDAAHFVSSDLGLDLGRRWMSRVWPTFSADGSVPTVTLLDADTIERIELAVSPADDPGPMSDAERVTLARGGRDKCRAVLRRVPGIGSRVAGWTPQRVPFAAGLVGTTRVVCLHVPADHIDGDEDDERGLRIMFAAVQAEAAFAALSRRPDLKPDPFAKDVLVISMDDPFGYLSRWHSDVAFTWNDGIALDLDWFSGEAKDRLLKLNLAHIAVVDAADPDPVTFRTGGLTISELFERDGEFLDGRLPRSEAGRWTRVMEGAKILGVALGFGLVDRHLKSAGWAVNHHAWDRAYDLEVQYVPVSASEEATGSSIRIVWSLSSCERGIAVVAVGHDHSDDDIPVAPFIRYVRDEVELKVVAAETMMRSKPSKRMKRRKERVNV